MYRENQTGREKNVHSDGVSTGRGSTVFVRETFYTFKDTTFLSRGGEIKKEIELNSSHFMIAAE